MTVVTELIEQAILDGLSDAQVRLRLLACGYHVHFSRIKARRKRLPGTNSAPRSARYRRAAASLITLSAALMLAVFLLLVRLADTATYAIAALGWLVASLAILLAGTETVLRNKIAASGARFAGAVGKRRRRPIWLA